MASLIARLKRLIWSQPVPKHVCTFESVYWGDRPYTADRWIKAAWPNFNPKALSWLASKIGHQDGVIEQFYLVSDAVAIIYPGICLECGAKVGCAAYVDTDSYEIVNRQRRLADIRKVRECEYGVFLRIDRVEPIETIQKRFLAGWDDLVARHRAQEQAKLESVQREEERKQRYLELKQAHEEVDSLTYRGSL